VPLKRSRRDLGAISAQEIIDDNELSGISHTVGVHVRSIYLYATHAVIEVVAATRRADKPPGSKWWPPHGVL